MVQLVKKNILTYKVKLIELKIGADFSSRRPIIKERVD